MIYEILDKNGAVTNTISADPAFMQSAFAPGSYRLVPESAEPEPKPIAPPDPPVWTWFIDLGPFYDRFGASKMAVLTSTDPGVKALLTDLGIRKWVDLKHPSVAQALAYIGTKVATVTPAVQTAILTAPVTDSENMALRKLYFW